MSTQRGRVLGLIVSTLFFGSAIVGYFGYRYYVDLPKEVFVANDSSLAQSGTKEAAINEEALKKTLDDVDSATGLSRATVVITTARGKIKFKFYTHDAPRTTARFAELIQSGFYDGLTFHRVEPQFVIQGGDPTGTGSGGSGKKLVAEFNSRKHVAGTVAMARAQDPNSADSQFYICLGTHAFLDQKYTVFGQVIEGQEVADQIQVGDRMTSVSLESR